MISTDLKVKLVLIVKMQSISKNSICEVAHIESGQTLG